MDGAKRDGDDGAGEADDVVGHAEVRRGQHHQQGLCVQAHKLTAGLRLVAREAEGRTSRSFSNHCNTSITPVALKIQAQR